MGGDNDAFNPFASTSDNLIIIEINQDIISKKMMLYILQFVYTGTCKVKMSETNQLSDIATRLLLDELSTFCSNMQTFAQNIDECKVMNASITSYWLDAVSEVYKEILYDRSFKYDLTIKTVFDSIKVAKKKEPELVDAVVGKLIYQTPDFQNDEVPTIEGDGNDLEEKKVNDDEDESEHNGEFRAHKIVPWSRNDNFQTKLSDAFKDSTDPMLIFNDVKSKTFGVFLEYLYTDHAPLNDQNEDDIDYMDLLKFSYFMRERRLISWCEYLMSKVIEKAVEQSIEHADIDIIDLLIKAQKFNAKQLEKFLLHFICTNYVPMRKKKSYALLKGNNLKYIEKNRWPPKWYEDECVEYEKKLKEWTDEYGKKNSGVSLFGKKKIDNVNGQKEESSECLIM